MVPILIHGVSGQEMVNFGIVVSVPRKTKVGIFVNIMMAYQFIS